MCGGVTHRRLVLTPSLGPAILATIFTQAGCRACTHWYSPGVGDTEILPCQCEAARHPRPHLGLPNSFFQHPIRIDWRSLECWHNLGPDHSEGLVPVPSMYLQNSPITPVHLGLGQRQPDCLASSWLGDLHQPCQVLVSSSGK